MSNNISYGSTNDDHTGLEGALNVGTTAIQLMVGTSPKIGRTNATLYNNSLVILYWGYTSAVTTTTGTPIKPGQFVSWDEIDDDTAIYIIAASNGNDARITEVSA